MKALRFLFPRSGMWTGFIFGTWNSLNVVLCVEQRWVVGAISIAFLVAWLAFRGLVFVVGVTDGSSYSTKEK